MSHLLPQTIGDADRLWACIEHTERLDALSNAALADLVEDHLWLPVPQLTPTSDVLAAVIERLRQKEDV
jgi:hypothetical protein